MNKQRYLAELQRLLVFMTDEDRELTVRRYADIFDAAGPEGEEAVVAELGSPTKAAISLSRGYEPGRLFDVLPELPAEDEPEPPAPAAPAVSEADPWDLLPDYELPELAEPSPAPGGAPTEELTQPPARREPLPAPVRRRPDAAPVREVLTRQRTIPLGAGIPLFILVMGALGLPLAALAAGLMALLLVPGCAVIFCAYLAAVGGLWCLSFIADAVMLFGAAFVILALGVIVLWAGIWLAGNLAGLYIKGVKWLAGELLLGRQVTVDAHA